MEKRSNPSVLVFAFLATLLAVYTTVELGLVERVSYAMERGRLRARRATLAPTLGLEETAHARRIVAEVASAALVTIETEFPPNGERTFLETMRLNPADGVTEDPLESFVDDGARVGLGSGFVFDADRGHILTNAHVAEGAQTIYVSLPDGRRIEATVLGMDSLSDLAVIGIPPTRLHDIPLGDSNNVEVGDEVFTVGNPFGLEGSVSRGIISSTDRHNIRIGGSLYESLFQTDALVTPGSSGGPLVNMRGEVIGITTAMATDDGDYEGVAFAVPSNAVKNRLSGLIDGGPGLLGVLAGSIGEPFWRPQGDVLGWNQTYGALVTDVMPGTAADRAGVRPTDIIHTIADARVESIEQLRRFIAATPPGTTLQLGLWRDRANLTMSVEIGRRYAPR
ncbi:MAG: S1C family serine protease [Phycisphaerae bacterium]